MMQQTGTQPPADLMPRTLSIIEGHRAIEGPLLPILHALQDEFGYVPTDSLPVVAEALNLSRAEVHGVVTFYHDYRNAPADGTS